MHWILILYFGSYGKSPVPHFMGEYVTQEKCQQVGQMLKAQGDQWGYGWIKEFNCISNQ